MEQNGVLKETDKYGQLTKGKREVSGEGQRFSTRGAGITGHLYAKTPENKSYLVPNVSQGDHIPKCTSTKTF